MILKERFNCLRQEGPACSAYMTAELLQHYDIYVDPKKIYDILPRFIDKEAVHPKDVCRFINTALAIKDIDRQYSVYKGCSIEDIERQLNTGCPVPVMILYDRESHTWDDLHYVLITGITKNAVYMIDTLHKSSKRQRYKDHSTKDKHYNRIVKIEDFLLMWGLCNTPVFSKMLHIRNIMFMEKPYKMKNFMEN